ncbi:MAG: radical SAM protein [Gammaproteobacteria bacterium]
MSDNLAAVRSPSRLVPVFPKIARVQQYLDEDPILASFYKKYRRHVAPIVSTNYDITDVCNLRCEGCLFFEGTDSRAHRDERTLEEYDQFFAAEAARGVNYPYFAGGEPALAQDRLRLAQRHFRRGMIFTNGTVRLDRDLPFAIHVSLWGDAHSTKKFRGAAVFGKSLTNYRGDPRATFIYTVTHLNIDSIADVVQVCHDQGARISFNHFSATAQYNAKLARGTPNDHAYFRFSTPADNLCLTATDRERIRDILDRMIDDYPDTVVYSTVYNEWISRAEGLYQLDPATGWASDCPTRDASFHKHYHVDLQESSGKCCSPNVDCRDCRAYAIAQATFRHRIRDYLVSRDAFARWVDVVETWCRLFLVGWDELR